jgi:4-hydroxybutyrate dehydrogenase
MIDSKLTKRYVSQSAVIFGAGSIIDLDIQLQRYECIRPLVVTGKHTIKYGLLDKIIDIIENYSLEAIILTDGNLNPTDKDVYTGAEIYRKYKCDSIIAIGGGSRLDLAKTIRLAAVKNSYITNYYFDNGIVVDNNVMNNAPALISIPTTAGSGSEVSKGAIITDTTQMRKRLIAGTGMMSTVSILDPELTITMNEQLTAMTGIDAFSHAIESYICFNSDPFVCGTALQAVNMIYKNLEIAVNNGYDIDARSNMLLASSTSAMAFSKGIGVTHSLAHQLSIIADIPHSLAIAILLKHSIEFNNRNFSKEYSRMAKYINAKSMYDVAFELSQLAGLPTRLSDVGVGLNQLDEIAEKAMLNYCHKTNSVPCNKSDMVNILESAM